MQPKFGGGIYEVIDKGVEAYAGEHVCDGASNLDTKQAGNAEQEANDAGDKTPPEEHATIP